MAVPHISSIYHRWLGTFFDPARDSSIYMEQQAFAAAMSLPGRSNSLFIETIDAGDDAVTASNLALKQFLEESNLPIVVNGLVDVTTIAEITARRLQGMSVLIDLLSIIILVVTIVDSIGLSETYRSASWSGRARLVSCAPSAPRRGLSLVQFGVHATTANRAFYSR